jgi:RHS repeat-associated protein
MSLHDVRDSDMLDGRNGRPKNGQPTAVNAPSLSLPKGGGAIRGIGEKFAANPVTGTGSMTVPLAISPGRSGFGPQLALSYDSGAGNGPFGIGWNLSLPAITRKTDKGLPQYLDIEPESDVFLLSGSEDLVPVLELQDGAWDKKTVERTVGGEAYIVHRYRPRIEGLFARIERWTRKRDGDTHWRSISKDNITTFYGRTEESRIGDPSDPSRIFSWLICTSFDDKGNAVVYSYKPEDGINVDQAAAHETNRLKGAGFAQRFIKRVRYGNLLPNRDVQWNATDPATLTDWFFELVFDYGEHLTATPTTKEVQTWPVRQDPFSSYRAAFEVRTYRLCRRVLMFHHFPDELGTPDYLVRATEFDYRETPIGSFITSIAHSGYRRQTDGTYLKKSLPSVDFDYSEATIQDEVREVDPENLANLPANVNGAGYQWLDLDGEGLQSVLAEQDDGWYYKRNLSPSTFAFVGGKPTASARFEPVAELASLPSFAQTATPHHQFMDLAGDGQLDCVVLEQPLAGFYERTEDQRWEPFRPLPSLPNIEWGDPNLRFLDLDGDGHADILITEHEALTWHPSLAEGGFGPAISVPKLKNEDDGPTIVFADIDQAVFLADMSGDGLTDIVRIRNGEVCYWPNLGYGHFGKKITMDASPWFETQDQFDQRRIRLADIDGSGTTDIIYLAHDGVRLYFNQSGNRWSEPRALPVFPRVDDLAHVQALDLLGNGTACLVWTSALAGNARHSMRYVDLMGGEKPHLLIGSRNNLGAETRIFYAPSTKFYLADRAAGQPWVTLLPFPVHVVERVETYDRVSRNRYVTRYSYHHGFYDGIEREFRGFGRVDQFDTEELGALTASGVFPDATNIDAASYVPTVLTKTWFHTGACLQEARISRHFEDEYWRESDLSEGLNGLSDTEFEAMLLPDTVLPPELDGGEMAEACRSLKGAELRQEVFALDGTDEADRPYTVSERNYTIRRLQPIGPNRHAVFFTHARETIDFHYERKLYDIEGRKLADPRVTHSVVLAVDDFGNPLKSVAVGYGRRHDDPDPRLTAEDRAKQKKIHLTCTEATYTNRILADHAYRAPLSADVRTFELINVVPGGTIANITNLFGLDELTAKVALAGNGHHDLPYEDINAQGATEAHPYRRLIEQVRALYRKDDLSGALPLGGVGSLALPFESYKLAFTAGLLAVYRRGPEALLPDPVTVLRQEAGYVLSDDQKAQGLFPTSDASGQWWAPSGRVFYSPDASDTPAQEIANATAHFFLPRRFRDPFGHDVTVRYDTRDLLALETEDALHNKITVGERAADGGISNRNDYRVLQPALITDPNGNRVEVAFDSLGMVAGTAVMGKPLPAPLEGDTLAGFVADLTRAQLNVLFEAADPLATAPSLLNGATTRVVYDFDRFRRTQEANPNDPTQWQPACAATLARETHVSAPLPPQGLTIQLYFSYSDGFGREIQKKVQAEPGALVEGGPTVAPRWVGSGWTILNNKGRPVRQYEPFFDDTHDFKFGIAVGVSPVLFYDPVERVAALLHPNHIFEKVVFDPWRQTSFDVNDTVTFNPKTDDDVKEFVTRLPDADYLPTWYALRTDPSLAAMAAVLWPDPNIRAAETDAATKAAVHANTPTVAFFDTLGRPFLTVAHNRFERDGAMVEEKYLTRVELDIEGNQRAIIDANGRIVMRYDTDVLGTRIHQASMEAGERWMLNDVTGKPIRTWNSRKYNFRAEYDALRRPLKSYVAGGDPGEPNAQVFANEILVERSVYGESQGATLNHRGRVSQHFDGAGLITNEVYDFKGNLRQSTRRLAQGYKGALDWSASPAIQTETYTRRIDYDALNRPVRSITPDNTVLRPTFNEANLLERVEANLRGAETAAPFVLDINYDAKGQRTSIAFRNGVKTTYDYDPLTFRLTRLASIRPAGLNGLATQLLKDAVTVQDLSYTYDPAGNITRIADDALPTLFFAEQRIDPVSLYSYDSQYRLIQAQGRESIGQSGLRLGPPQPTYRDYPYAGLGAQSFDPKAVRNYTERYHYDRLGNFQNTNHQAKNGAWVRDYRYEENSLLEPDNQSNRLSSTIVHPNGDQPIREPYSYDAHGNMIAMPHLSLMRWDFNDRLVATARQVVTEGTPEMTYYVYDAAGQRVRKVTERQDGTRKNERAYLGGFEVYWEYDGSGTVTLERETLHVMDDRQRIALVETRTDTSIPEQLIRYQFSNHLGSASLELDDAAQIISYEEYYPYGGTSYQAGRSAAEVGLKRYRHTGKEKDEETGFSYHGARYYVAWLGRWLSCDRIGIAGGTNLYQYAEAAPITKIDSNGLQPENALGDLFTFIGDTAKFLEGLPLGRTWQKVGQDVHTMATTLTDELKKPGPNRLLDIDRVYSEVRVDQGKVAQIGGKPGGGKGALNPDLVGVKKGQALSIGDSQADVASKTEVVGDIKGGGKAKIAKKYSALGGEQMTVNGVTSSAATDVKLLQMAKPQEPHGQLGAAAGGQALPENPPVEPATGLGKSSVKLGASTVASIISFVGTLQQAREFSMAIQGIRDDGPLVLSDESGYYYLRENCGHLGIFCAPYKEYITGFLAKLGLQVEISGFRYAILARQAEEEWGYLNFWGNFVPGRRDPRENRLLLDNIHDERPPKSCNDTPGCI